MQKVGETKETRTIVLQRKDQVWPLLAKRVRVGTNKDFKLKTNCFLYDGPHWACECPKRKALNAMI